MQSVDVPEPAPQPVPDPVPVAPCAPDAAVAQDYDSATNGRCANGHPLNRMGRCAVVNGQQP